MLILFYVTVSKKCTEMIIFILLNSARETGTFKNTEIEVGVENNDGCYINVKKI